jgi:hypothetical protein
VNAFKLLSRKYLNSIPGSLEFLTNSRKSSRGLTYSFAESMDIVARVVWDPPMTYPHAGTVWTANETQHVRWSVPSRNRLPMVNNL